MNTCMGQWRGFTLIELLIVVAIIAILAAIAVPNFLEAQTRSKVARVKNDMRTLGTALTAFHVDHGWFIFAGNEGFQHIVDPMWSLPGWYSPPKNYPKATLTTPIAYISDVLFDVFAKPNTVISGSEGVASRGGGWHYGTDPTGKRAFCLESFGPDAIQTPPNAGGSLESFRSYYRSSGLQRARLLFELGSYDATNGTRSQGDIYRIGP